MPTDVINRVNQIGRSQGMKSSLIYSNRQGDEIADTLNEMDEITDLNDSTQGSLSTEEDEDLSFEYYDDDNDSDDDDDSDNDGDETVHTNMPDNNDDHDESSHNNDNISQDNFHLVGPDQYNYTDSESTGVIEGDECTEVVTNEEAEGSLTEEQMFRDAEELGIQQAQNDTMPSRKLVRKQNINPDFVYQALENSTETNDVVQKSLSTLPNETFLNTIASHAKELMSYLTQQMTAKKGLKIFGDRGKEALMRELQQLLYRSVMHPVSAKSLTIEQKKAALSYLMFLKEKRSGEVKGRGCADGRKQRVYKTKDETHSPTVSTEAMFITDIFDALEERDVAIVDIPGAFMQVEIDELIHVKLDGELVDLLVRLDPTYAAFIVHERGKRVIYTELDKALYGTLQAAVLFWRKLSTFLIYDLGFTANPYDSCVVNKQIDDSQFTICWHVDDLKLSHKSDHVVTDIIHHLQKEFGKESPLTKKRGGIFDDYLGMRMDFSKPGKVIFSMIQYIERIIDECPSELVKGPCGTPAANHLFQVNDDDNPLAEKDAELYHHLTAMLLYLSKKTRPDIQVAVSFLSTRVKARTCDDWKN